MSTISVQLEDVINQNVLEFSKTKGYTMSEAINFFLWEGIKANDAPPEEYDQSNCNAETIAAFEEVEYMEAHPDEFNSYSSIKELHKEILAEMRADGEI